MSSARSFHDYRCGNGNPATSTPVALRALFPHPATSSRERRSLYETGPGVIHFVTSLSSISSTSVQDVRVSTGDTSTHCSISPSKEALFRVRHLGNLVQLNFVVQNYILLYMYSSM